MDDSAILSQLGTQPQQQQPDLNSFGRLAVSIPKMQDILKALGGAAMAPVNAAGNILNQGDLLPSRMSINPGREGLVASSILSPAIGRALSGGAAGELGVSGTDLLKRTDVRKLIQDMHAGGSKPKDIAALINERYAPLLDTDAKPINVNQLYDKLKPPTYKYISGTRN